MKKIITILGLIVVVGLGATFYIIGPDLFGYMETAEKEASGDVEELREGLGGSVTKEDMEQFKKEGKNPFGRTTKIENLTDDSYRDYIHGMSHQKIKADRKWGFYQINEERIDWLLEGLEKADPNNLESYQTYKTILERWKANDFSRVDADHNVIWEMQNGTIGRATGIMSAEEEQRYIESQK